MTEEARQIADNLQALLQNGMPEDLRARIEALLSDPDASAWALKSAFQSVAKRLVLARPRAEICWNPAVDEGKCTGCGVCFRFCPHGVYEMRDGRAAVVRPAECVILCSNCAKKCPSGAISFPPQTEYSQFLH